MEYYCIFVKSGEEEKFKASAQKIISENGLDGQFYFFTADAWDKKAKFKNKVVRPAFPGYVFLKVEKLVPDLVFLVSKIEGFLRFLPTTQGVHKIEGAASENIIRFIETGERHQMSKAVYEKGSRVRIISGDIKTFEAYITHWDPKHQKVRVQLPNQSISWSFELSYDIVMEKLP